MKNILITGGAGFIGSNFIPYFLNQHQGYRVINLDKLTYAGNLDNLTDIVSHPRYHFIQGDITDTEIVNHIFQKWLPQGVIHFAAETHVDRSIADAFPFVRTNVEGTFVLLESARKHWLIAPGAPHPDHTSSRFLQVSTDEVYGSLGPTGFFNEESNYAPNNPYSATKAAGDCLVRSYHHTHGVQTLITHGSNTYGPNQYPEKLIPKIIQQALARQPIPIHGKGTAIRDWLYVMDHCKGIDAAFHHGQSGERYNLGGQHEKSVIEITKQICQWLDEYMPLPASQSYQSLIQLVEDRPGNDQRYALAIDKAKTLLGWQPVMNFKEGLTQTINWYVKKLNNHQIKSVC